MLENRLLKANLEEHVYLYRLKRVLGLFLEASWIGWVLLDAYLFFAPSTLGVFQRWLWCGMIAFALAPSLYLHFNYRRFSVGRSIEVQDHQIVWSAPEHSSIIDLTQIALIEVVHTRLRIAPWRTYDYFILITQAGESWVIPNYLMSYLDFARNSRVSAVLNDSNPEVRFINRFPLILVRPQSLNPDA